MNWHTVKPSEKINFFGWQYGHPVLDRSGVLLGYAASMPTYEGEEVEFISLEGNVSVIS